MDCMESLECVFFHCPLHGTLQEKTPGPTVGQDAGLRGFNYTPVSSIYIRAGVPE